MLWKTISFAFLAVGVLAENKVTNERREQCKNNATENKVSWAAEIKNAGRNIAECLTGLVDTHVLKHEMKTAKPNGALGELFNKYCVKVPQLKTCIHNIVDRVALCVDQSTLVHLSLVKNYTDRVIDYVCYRDGERLALFAAEDGPECLEEKFDSIQSCVVTVRESVPNTEDVSNMSTLEQCGKFDELWACFTSSVEQCSYPTTGNMAKDLYRSLREESPCDTELPKKW